MIANLLQAVSGIFVNNQFIKNLYIGNELIFRQSIDGFGMFILDNLELENIDDLPVGSDK
jgi:hypothetical protein